MAELIDKISCLWDAILAKRLSEKHPLIQILIGPRQVGKTTSLKALVEKFGPDLTLYASADERQLEDALWIEMHWKRARAKQSTKTILLLDEIQKISNWSETVKRLWDEDSGSKFRPKIVLSGSSSLTIQSGLSESLAGRFEIIPATHFGFGEFQKLCGGTLQQYIFFGGYPGALRFIDDEERWRNYINQSIIESILSKDILLMTRVDKPALLRRLFQLGCEYSGQVLSFQKAVGMLRDAGNTTTLAHYLDLLDQAFVLRGLQKFETRKFRLRASSPKYQVHNTALMGAQGPYTFTEAKSHPDIWGRYLESCIGAHLVNWSRIAGFEVCYWRDSNAEVDFVVRRGRDVAAIEVKSGRRGKLYGLGKFAKVLKGATRHIIGDDDEELMRFLTSNPLRFLFG